MSTKDLAYYEEHPDEMTDEIMETLLTGGVIEDDIDSEQSDEETGKQSEAGAEPQKDEEQEPTPVVLAKDGKHTIPFEELEKSRAEAKAAREELAAVKQQIAELEQERANLQAARDEKAAAGEDTSALDAQLAEFDEEFPSIAGNVRHLVNNELKTLREEVAALKSAVQPIQANARVSAEEAHFTAIRTAHADFDDLIESGKLDAWVKELPAYARPGAMAVMESGSAQDVIGLIADYKSAHPEVKTDETPSAAEMAKQAVDKAKTKASVPSSLSEVPSAGMAPSEELGAYEQMGDTALLGAFMSMDPAKLNDRLNRLL